VSKPSEKPSAADHDLGAAALLDGARRHFWSAPELTVVLARHVETQSPREGELRLQAGALAMAAGSSIETQLDEALDLIAVPSNEAKTRESLALLRLRVADLAQRVGRPRHALGLLAPALEADEPFECGSVAIAIAARCLAELGKRSRRGGTLADAERIAMLDHRLDATTSVVCAAAVCVHAAAAARFGGALDAAMEHAEHGLLSMEPLADADRSGHGIAAALTLELVLASLALGAGPERVARLAQPVLDAPVRVGSAGAVAWLAVALATRVHEPGRADSNALLERAAQLGDRHGRYDVLAAATHQLAAMHEDSATGMHLVRTAQLADARHRRHRQLVRRVLDARQTPAEGPMTRLSDELGRHCAGHLVALTQPLVEAEEVARPAKWGRESLVDSETTGPIHFLRPAVKAASITATPAKTPSADALSSASEPDAAGTAADGSAETTAFETTPTETAATESAATGGTTANAGVGETRQGTEPPRLDATHTDVEFTAETATAATETAVVVTAGAASTTPDMPPASDDIAPSGNARDVTATDNDAPPSAIGPTGTVSWQAKPFGADEVDSAPGAGTFPEATAIAPATENSPAFDATEPLEDEWKPLPPNESSEPHAPAELSADEKTPVALGKQAEPPSIQGDSVDPDEAPPGLAHVPGLVVREGKGGRRRATDPSGREAAGGRRRAPEAETAGGRKRASETSEPTAGRRRAPETAGDERTGGHRRAKETPSTATTEPAVTSPETAGHEMYRPTDAETAATRTQVSPEAPTPVTEQAAVSDQTPVSEEAAPNAKHQRPPQESHSPGVAPEQRKSPNAVPSAETEETAAPGVEATTPEPRAAPSGQSTDPQRRQSDSPHTDEPREKPPIPDGPGPDVPVVPEPPDVPPTSDPDVTPTTGEQHIHGAPEKMKFADLLAEAMDVYHQHDAAETPGNARHRKPDVNRANGGSTPHEPAEDTTQSRHDWRGDEWWSAEEVGND
jgi:hypothetical protein